jgi:hypothetical protein
MAASPRSATEGCGMVLAAWATARRARCRRAIAQPSWIIANTINETARGDPDALASRIVAALVEAGYGIVPANGIEDTALGPQPFDKLTREMRPQDPFGDGRDWTFRTGEHGGDEPDNMPQTHQGDR